MINEAKLLRRSLFRFQSVINFILFLYTTERTQYLHDF